jgi:hypothetical protein
MHDAQRTDDDELSRQATRIVLRPIANPLPLGFLAPAGGLPARIRRVAGEAGVRERL